MTEHKRISKADMLIYKALNKAIENDKLRIYLDYGKINRPGSPVYDPWESLLPILIPVLLGLLLIFSVGVLFGLLFIVAMISVYSVYFKKKIYRRLIERTKRYITTGYEHCDTLWNFGGLVFVNAENKKLGCVSPEGDWKDFVVLNFSEFMTEHKEEPKEEKEEKKEEAPDENAKAKTRSRTNSRR